MVVGNWHGRLPGSCPLLLRVSPITGMVGCPFHLRTSIINSTGGCLFTFLVFNVNCCAYSAPYSWHTVGYLVIPTRTACIKDEQ